MSRLVKCPECQTWNEGHDFCTKCNCLLDYETKRQMELDEQDLAETRRPIGQLMGYFERLSKSGSTADHVKYRFFNVTWWLLVAFLSLSIAFVALGPG